MPKTSPTPKRVFEKSLGYPDARGIPSTRIPQFSPYSMQPAQIMHVKVTETAFTVEMTDGRMLQAPTVALLPVFDLPARQRRQFRIVDDNTAVEWPLLNYKVTLRQLMGVE